MTNNLISIIVPAYNASDRIEHTLNSLMNQTYKNLEIIIVNDASKDDTLDLVMDFSAQDERIKIINLEKNVGVHEARMCGLRKSKGDWIGFMDADDHAHLDMYQSMLNNALKNQADIVLCGVERVNDKGKHLRYVPEFKSDYLVTNDLVKNLTDYHFGAGYLWNKLYAREVIVPAVDEKFPWRQSLNEDMIVNIGCFLKAKKVYLSKSVFYTYVENESSATAVGDKVRAYVEHLKAFSIALHLYGKESAVVQEMIFNMYRNQITQEHMHIENIQELYQYEKEILDAIKLNETDYPLAWAMLAARNSESNSLSKKTLLKIIHKVITKYFVKNQFKYIKS